MSSQPNPGLVAAAVDAIAADEGGLFQVDWTIVTNDGAVQDAAARRGVATMKPSELAALVDEAA